VALILIGRLYVVQVVHGETFSDRANRQYVRPNQNLYDRGSIFFKDRDGRLVSGATLKAGYTVAVNPNIIKKPDEIYISLNEVVDVEEENFMYRASREDDTYEEVKKRATLEDAEKIQELDLDGVSVHKERWRFYPGDTLAAHTLGFVGFQGDILSGRYGLERYYDDVLSRDGSSIYVNFFAEVFSNLGKTIFKGEPREGDLITSIEPSVQLQLERVVNEISEEWNARRSAGVIINPQTGDIYAVAVDPSFDVNNFSKEESSSIFTNPLVENVYEMGSIMKPLTMAAGIDSGAVTATTTYYDSGSIDLDGYTISNFDGEGRGRVPMQEVLNQSLNTGVSFVVDEMGEKVFRDYLYGFGVSDETGIDLPGEVPGLVSNLESPRKLEYATASFGQGIALTPIATVRALSTLANAGVPTSPHVVNEIKYKSGLTKKVTPTKGEQVISKKSSEEITRMLVEVVDEALLGGTVAMENYSIAAKTGTAQIAKVGERGYYDDRFLHSFFGYFPAYDPQFLIFLMTIEPKEVRYASQTLTHPFIDTVKFLINYYSVPPDR
jgi:cell division protein FtsI/penicillin-binding protein 2|tara:strand:+ start:23782 stop:25437 length:1656 start_codon:yes stop_codon:yes gene_type:complete